MKKNLKLVLALVLAAMMIVGSISAIAAGTGADATVTIGGLDKDDTVKLYKVIKWVGDADDNVNGWAWNEDVIDTDIDLRSLVNDDNVLEISSETAGKLSRAIKDGAAYQEKKCTADGGSVEFATPEGTGAENDAVEKNMGMYMALITPAKTDTVYNPVFVSADFNGGGDWTIVPDSSSYTAVKYAAKKSTIPLDKEAHSDSDANDRTDADDGDTVYPGDTLDFKVTTKIPGYGDTFDEPFYKLRDTLKDLTLTDDEIVVKVNGEEISDGFTATPAADGKSYEIVFDSDYLKTLTQAADLEVTYKATVDELDEGSYANVEKEKNTVELEYSHDPSTEDGSHKGGKKKFQKDITNHYTFSIDANSLISGKTVTRPGESGSELIKVGVDINGKPITESKTWSKVGDAVEEEIDGTLAGAEFKLTAKDGSNKTWTAISDAEGRINFEGLDAGTYELEEIKAPRGYVRDTEKHTIVITATMSAEKTVTEYYDQQGNWYENKADAPAGTEVDPYTYKFTELESYSITVDGKTASSYTFGHAFEDEDTKIKWSVPTSTELPTSIINTKGVELPSTGGMGTTIFYVGGSILVLAAAILLVTKRRMGVED